MESLSEAGRILRRLREVRGWSQTRLAVELGRQAKRIGRSVPSRESLVRMVRMWEAGTHRPRDYYELFILVYATDGELLPRTIIPGSDLDQLMTAFEAMGIPMDRRKFLLNSAALAVGAALEPTRHSVLDLFDDDPLPHAVGRLEYIRGLKWSGEPAHLVHTLLVHHANDLDRMPARFAGSDVRQDLRAVQARAFSDAGGTAFYDLGLHYQAEMHFRSGMQAAKKSNDPRLQAKLCANLASRRVHDPSGDEASLHDALWIADSGVKYADGNPFILTDIYNWQAFIHASLENESATREALEQASIAMESAKSSDEPEWLRGVSMAQVQETAGCSYLRLGEPRRAADEISRALKTRAAVGDPNRVHACEVLTWGAQASAKIKEPEHAVSLLQQAIPVVSRSKSVRRAQEVHLARSALAPWEGEPFMRELDEQLSEAGLA